MVIAIASDSDEWTAATARRCNADRLRANSGSLGPGVELAADGWPCRGGRAAAGGGGDGARAGGGSEASTEPGCERFCGDGPSGGGGEGRETAASIDGPEEVYGGGGGGIEDAMLAAREACPALDAMIRAAGLGSLACLARRGALL
jgi:hypothetical protein